VKPKLSAIVILWILALFIVPLRLSQLRQSKKGPTSTPRPASSEPLPLSIPASKSDNVEAKATASASAAAAGAARISEQPRLVRLHSADRRN